MQKKKKKRNRTWKCFKPFSSIGLHIIIYFKNINLKYNIKEKIKEYISFKLIGEIFPRKIKDTFLILSILLTFPFPSNWCSRGHFTTVIDRILLQVYIYIYIYIYVCVCVYVCVCGFYDLKVIQILLTILSNLIFTCPSKNRRRKRQLKPLKSRFFSTEIHLMIAFSVLLKICETYIYEMTTKEGEILINFSF